MEENFKVCGLCSQLVDESVEITTSLRSFLCEFLQLLDHKLPAKICLECYQKATDCRNFKERCDKAIFKLNKHSIYSAMILGGSATEIAKATGRSVQEDKKLMEEEKRTRVILDSSSEMDVDVPIQPVKKPGPASRKSGPASKTPKARPRGMATPPPEILDGPRSTRSASSFAAATPATSLRSKGPLPTPRAQRHSFSSPSKPASAPRRTKGRPGIKSHEARVIISKRDFSLAEKALKKFGPPPPEDRKRKSTIGNVTPPEKRRKQVETASGRVVKSSRPRSFVFDDFTEVSDDDEAKSDGPVVVARKSVPKPAPRAKPAPKSASKKPVPASKKKPVKVEPAEPVVEEDDDLEEIFPTIGPYQCEICQKITDTKQDFVDHIKKYHLNVVDEEVLKSLESDLRKNKIKAEREARKKTPKSSKKAPKAAAPKTAPVDDLSPAMQRKRNAPVEDRTCKVCDTVLSSPLKTDHERHQKSQRCRQIAMEKGLLPDPLSTSPGSKKAKKVEDPSERTCQFCGKIMSRKSDLSGHYKTKACVAKQYEREAKQENFVDTSIAASGEDEQAVSNTPVVMENAEADEEYTASTADVGGEPSPSNLPSSTTNEPEAHPVAAETAPITKVEHLNVKPEHPAVNKELEGPVDPLGATSTTNKDMNGSTDWLSGPITTIADTLSEELPTEAIDPLQGVDPFAPTAILDGLNST